MTSHDKCAAMWGEPEPTAACADRNSARVCKGCDMSESRQPRLCTSTQQQRCVSVLLPMHSLEVWRTEAYLVQKKPPQVKGSLFLQCNLAPLQSEFQNSSSIEWHCWAHRPLPSSPNRSQEGARAHPCSLPPPLPSHLPSFLRKGCSSALLTTASPSTTKNLLKLLY